MITISTEAATTAQDQLFRETNYFSNRLLNILFNNRQHLGLVKNFEILKVKDFSQISKKQLFNCRNFGEKMKRDVESLCRAYNIEMLP